MSSLPKAGIDLIRGIPLFEHCSTGELTMLVEIADELDLAAGTVLVREDERGRELFAIAEGEAELSRQGKPLALLGPGDVVGEMALLARLPSNLTAVALTAVNVLVITDRDFRNLVDEVPNLWPKLAQALAERIVRDSGVPTPSRAAQDVD